METPLLVLRALALAEETGFELSSSPEVGALHHVLSLPRDADASARAGRCR